MLGRGRRRGIEQQHPHRNQLQELSSDDHCYPTDEMPHRRKQSKTTTRRSFVLNWTLASTFALGLLLLLVQVATWNHSPDGTTIGGMAEPTQLTTANKQSNTPSSWNNNNNNNNAVQQRRHLREVSTTTTIPFPKTLVGIFTTLDDPSKDWHRQNLAQYSQHICALGDYESSTKLSLSEKEACQVIYTFVIGGNMDPNAPTELLTVPDDENNTNKNKAATAQHHSLLVNTKGQNLPKDVHENDCTLLNIRENEHQGKSQTFLYFASLLLKQQQEGHQEQGQVNTIDYVMKIDAQTKVNWKDFFSFAVDQLPPAPYNTNMIGGALRDKAMWWGDFEAVDEEFRKGYDDSLSSSKPSQVKQRKLNKPPTKPHPSQMDRLESFWGNEFGGVHLYVDGQLYFLSSDLVHFVANEALYAKSRIGFGGYLEGLEDHDISAMVWHAPSPIHVVPLTKSQRFWEYPVGPPPAAPL
ncbi:unnamed protein product [Cylindrotheca closterium]|uniref:Hexosyltransferase n=1 Tax=Cylindrotheca closterium TaxID=2856 RepID=A0AAD2FZ36_9STRA|nr:unnamed protein product [Cylindrotheca closterium]